MPKKYKRHPNGTGTVYKMSGNRRKPWRAYLPATEDDIGNFQRRTIGYYETRQEALDALTLYRLAPHPEDNGIKLDELFDRWKESAYKNISRSSIDGYNAAWKHLSPIRKYKVVDVKTPQIQFCVDEMERVGASYSSIHKVQVLASRLEDYAVQLDLKEKNYAKFVTLKKHDDEEKEIFSDMQIRKLCEAADAGVGVADIIMIMIYTGWRIQEFCNLTRFDFDEEAKTLTGGLKTTAGKNRTVPVPDKVMPYLMRHMEHDQDSIFCYKNAKGEWSPYTAKKLRQEFYTTLDTLGIRPSMTEKFTPHVTRHTFNSLLLRSGVDVKIRMMLSGHSDMKTNVKTYSHADMEQLKNAVNCI